MWILQLKPILCNLKYCMKKKKNLRQNKPLNYLKISKCLFYIIKRKQKASAFKNIL